MPVASPAEGIPGRLKVGVSGNSGNQGQQVEEYMLQRHPRAKAPFVEVLLNLFEFSKSRLWCQNKCLYLNKGNETEN